MGWSGKKVFGSRTAYEPLSAKNWTYWQGQERHVLRVRETGQIAYCLQPGTYLYDWGISANPELSGKLNHAWENLSKDKQNAIKLAMYFGYPNTNTALSGTANEKELATQLIIWEFISGYRDTVSYNRTDARFIKALCGNNYDQNTGIYKAYGQIESAIKSFKTIISFTGGKTDSAPTHTMKWDGTKYTLTLTDSNGVLEKYSLSCSDSNVRLSKNGNKLTVTSTHPISSAVPVKASKAVSTGSSSTIVYGHQSADIQDVIVKTDSPDPIYGYFKLKTEATGSLRVVKQYKDLNGNNVKSGIESFVLNNTKFKIRNSAGKYIRASYPGSGYVYSYTGYVSSASDGTAFTPKNNNGDFYFEINKLPPGTYEIIEQDNNITGYTASGSKNIKVAVTANNSGGKKTATFQNKPDQLIINKVFNQFGAVKDEDYAKVVFNLSQINAEGVAATKSFICTDTENNVYQFINSTSDTAFSGIVTSKELRFVNPKVHSITVTGLPITNNNGYYYRFEVREVKNGHTNRYNYNTLTKTFETGTSQSGTITNDERKMGYIEIKKDFKIEQTDGTLVDFEGNNNLTLTQAYGDISFTVKDSSGKYIKAVYKGTNYSYSNTTSVASEATRFVFNGGNTSGIRINDMPFGTYSVTEVTGSKVKGQGFRVQESATKKTTTSYNISADTVTGGNVKFVNVKPQYVGLRIYKTFTNNEGESINVSNRIYDQVEFSVKDENGNDVEFVMQNKNSGAYTVHNSDYTTPPLTVIKLGTDIKTITLTGLEAGKTYTVTEKIAGSDLKKICVCKSLFTVEGTKENAVIYAPDDAVVQSGTVTMPTGENSVAEVHFENTYKTTGLTIYKESDDDLVERQFAVTTTNYDLYPESDPLYVMSEVTTGADGKVRGIAKVNDLPLAYYDHDTDSIVNIQYKIEEVDTPEYYEIPAAQTIIPMNGQTSVTIKNKLKTGKIRIIKKAEVNGSDEIIPLEGIEFSLKNSYNKTVLSAVTDANGEILFENLPIAVGVKNPDGSESVKKIRYTVSELAGKNNEKYVLADDQTVTLDYTKEANKRIKTLQIMNTPITGNVFLEKADERTLELLSGAEFTLYDSNGKSVKVVTTDKDGIADFGQHRYGKYTVIETTAPEKYLADNTPIPFEILEHGKIYGYTHENTPIEGNIEIIKVEKDTHKPLSGAEFTLFDNTGNAVQVITTGKDGKAFFAEVPYGNYTVAETKAPKDYKKDSTPIPFEILEHGKTLTVTKKNKPEEGTGTFIKTSEDGIVKDVALHICGKSNTGIEVDETVVTDENGSVSLSLLTGTYTVEEISVADRYVSPAKQTVTIKADKTSAVTFNNILKRGKVTTTKVDEEYPDNKLTGAVFEVYDADGQLVDTLKEVSEGVYELSELTVGNYTLKETKAPVGFLLDTNAYDFSIVNDGDVISIETKAGVGFINTPIKGTISVVKVDDKTRKPLSGAEFTIYNTNGDPIKTSTTDTGVVVTNAEGIADFGELRYGTYIVRETKAPDNYELDDTPIPFQILENGKVIEYEKGDPAEEGSLEIIKRSEDGVIENVKFHIYGTSANGTDINETILTDKDGKFLIDNLLIGTYTVEELEIADRYIKTNPKTVVVSANETATVTFENILKRGKVTTTKIDKDYPENKLTGAVFEVYDADGQLVDTLKEVSEGVYELSGLTTGNYTLKETKAPDGFDLDENAYPFEITENGDVRNIETLAGVGFINDAQKGDLVIHKRSSDKKLEDFSFRITGKTITGQEYDRTFTTDKDGIITVSGLRIGTYTVSEIADEATERYILPDDQTVDIRSKEVTDVEFYNDERVISFEITKSDISTGELIPGCGFRIRNSDGEIVIEGYTDENGVAKFELVCGDYTYQEFDAPDGYTIDEKEYPFTINPDDTIVKAEMSNTGTGSIEITKTDISNGVLIPDCGIEILDADKKVIRQGRTDKNGIVRFDALPYGKYFYREFDAPEGYILDETPFEFEVKENGEIIKANMTNKPVEKKPGYITTDTPKNPGKVTTPQTGDDSNTMAAIFSIICLISVAGIFLTRRSRKKDEED